MSQKHLLTVFHCVVAVVVTPVGMVWAGNVAERSLAACVAGFIAAVVLPVLIATRVSWASGYAAGMRDAGMGARDRVGSL